MFDEEQSKFTGNPELSKELAELQHPYQFFKYFFDDELIHKIADQSLLYSTQKNPAKPKTLTKRDIEKYLGILIVSSVTNCTSLRDMWHPVLGYDTIKNCMGVNSFESI